MKKIFIFSVLIIIVSASSAQYKYDNVLFKTVFTEDLCATIAENNDALYLDVRSPAEYMDTTEGFNFGRFKTAVNIDIRELPDRIAEIYPFRDKPVFVYCSHSQRSRRAGKMLADSGFTRVYNINGGMTGIRQFPVASNPCLYEKLETSVDYRIISATELCNKLSNRSKDIFLLDVRSDSAFRHISLDAKVNAYGYFKNSVNIPLSDIASSLSKIPADKEIIVIDLFGGDAARAAQLLKNNAYARVSILLEGIDRLLNTDPKTLPCINAAYISHLPYRIMNPYELKPFIDSKKDFIFLDVRTQEEYANKHKNYWQNLGHLANAINIPEADLDMQWVKVSNYKNKPVIIYVFGSGAEAHKAARTLVGKGFKDIRVLQGGIFNVGWTAANIKGYSTLAGLRVDVPDQN